MAKTEPNEREFVGQVIYWIKKRISEGGIPFEHATNDSSLYGLKRVKFPDVLITLDLEGHQPFCGWECKTPETDVRDQKLLKDAVEKAQTIGARYFVTWNMQTAIIWRTPEKTRVIVDEGYKVREIGPDPRITKVRDLRDPKKAEVLEETCRRLLLDLGKLYKDERINLPIADKTVFVGMVSTASEKLAETLFEDLRKARANKSFNRRLNAWARKQGVNKYDQEYCETLAQQIAYKIIGKVLFYLTLRRQNLRLPKLDLKGENYKAAMRKMRSLFESALEVDYQAIFERDITDEIELSRQSAEVVIELTDKLAHWSFELMPLDVIGYVFERLVPEEARHDLGQYFTPDNLVDLITAFCVRNENDVVMDPTCGTGTFLIRIYERLRALGAKRKPHHKLLEQIWGFDIAGFPAELATINLYRQDLGDYRNFPRVLAKDFFDVMPGAEFRFPPPKKTAKAGDRIAVQIPQFDALVGNFPFIRQELIEKAEQGYKGKLERVLFEDWGKGYPSLFRDGKDKNAHKLRLSGQADIYAYLYFHTAAHLKEGRRMGFVTSNSWLDVAYGYELQKFFLSKFKLIGIFESRCEPWFEQSAVNTVFTILERCDDQEEQSGNYVRFVKVKKPLGKLFPEDALTDAQSRMIGLERFVEKIEELGDRWEACGGEGFKRFGAINAKYVKQPEIISYEDDEVRVRMIRQGDLFKQVQEAGKTVKWGQYLRGPDIYFEILEKCADKLVPLGEIADIRRGITTGKNKFFYLTKEQVEHWGIEDEFLKPVVESPKRCMGVVVNQREVDYFVFLCHKEKSELKGTRALKYIQWGENQRRGDGVSWADGQTVKVRRNWYDLGKRESGALLLPRVTGRRLRAVLNESDVQVDDDMFEVMRSEKTCVLGLWVFLNSAWALLDRELRGKVNLGDGALKVDGPEWRGTLVPERVLLSIVAAKGEPKLRMLACRKVADVRVEARRKDRIAFEEAVVEAMGFPKRAAKEILAAVVDLVEERHLLPKLRRVRKKKRVKQDLEKLREEVVEEVLPNGVKRFPDAYVKGWSGVEWKEVAVPARRVKLGEAGIGVQEICDEEGNQVMEVEGLARAKFIVYAKRPDEQVVRMPVDAIVVSKAVQDYEADVREIRDRLYGAIIEKSGNHNVAENLALEVCEDFGLPDVR